MDIDTGGPAFPATGRYVDKDTFEPFTQGGMTLRDWFAGMAMQGYLSDNEIDGTYEVFAKAAYETADAMIAQRKREVP